MTSRRDGDELLGLARALIAIESHADAEGREAKAGRFLAEWFDRQGIDVRSIPVEGERANVVATVRGDGGGARLLLCGHLDTVPAGDMVDAFAPRIRGGVLWGRGACDMKGAVAAMAVAMAEINRAQRRGAVRLDGDVLFAGTVGEETGSDGVKALLDAGCTADHAIVGEPTRLRVAIAHKGACFVRIQLVGRGAHGSCPERGVNAASYAARVVAAIEDVLRPRLGKRADPTLGAGTVSVGRLCGGTQPNIVAERCSIDIDRRVLPGESGVVEEIAALVSDVCGCVDGLSYTVAELDETAHVAHAPLGTSPDSAIVESAAAACCDLGLDPRPIGVTYWTDGGYLSLCGVDTIVLGPGDIADAHGPAERVGVDDLRRAALVYHRAAIGIAGGRTGRGETSVRR